MSSSLTDRYLKRLRLRLALFYSIAMTVAVAVLVIVVLRVDSNLRESDMHGTLLAKAQEAAAAVVIDGDGAIRPERFLDDSTLVEGWPQVWLYEKDDGNAIALAGPESDWYEADLDQLAYGVLFEEVDWLSWVGKATSGSDIVARGVPVLDPESDEVRVAAIAVVDSADFYVDHDRLRSRVFAAAIVLVGLATWAGYWVAGKGTAATGEALAQQEQLLSDSAHELRTPIARIRAVAESGVAGDEPPDVALKRVVGLGEDATQMVDDMLFLARMDAEKGELETESVRLDLLAEEVAEGFDRMRIEAVETVASVNPGLVRRAISNLLGNAYLHGAGAEVKLTVYPTVVVVSDHGPGIDPSVAEGLFERFHKGPNSTGHGLGLPIVRWIAEVHGGSVDVSNGPTGGVVATLQLPN